MKRVCVIEDSISERAESFLEVKLWWGGGGMSGCRFCENAGIGMVFGGLARGLGLGLARSRAKLFTGLIYLSTADRFSCAGASFGAFVVAGLGGGGPVTSGSGSPSSKTCFF